MTENLEPHQDDRDTRSALTPEEQSKLLGFSELLFFAYRDFTGDPDAILQVLGFGRAHHRVLHFVTRQPGLRVADLLELLKITKQSLGRVLRQLVDTGYIRQEAGSQDRRERRLFPTESGEDLARRLSAPQLVRFANALEAAGPKAEIVVMRFLEAMANAEDRPQMAEMVSNEVNTLKSSARPGRKRRDDGTPSDLKASRERAG
ncbi:MarR family protein [Methyloligella halotolerans]|uniref:MarR family protein n=1 Tax=Methyloligella halotolerans TaxID=1177755 RepID=A0A1E2RXQ7_9HYPH|nr:MarR family protein [Methyloligella halotolerans]